eukprot:Rmarinus@m.20055
MGWMWTWLVNHVSPSFRDFSAESVVSLFPSFISLLVILCGSLISTIVIAFVRHRTFEQHRIDRLRSARELNVSFIHPDLGIGGAERLVVDAAVSLQDRDHNVTLYTSHHEPERCFEETAPGGELGSRVFVYGDFWPRHFFGRFHALFAYWRCFYVALRVIIGTSPAEIDVVVCDLVSLPNVLFRLAKIKVLFYCHYPDKALCTSRGTAVMDFYRVFIDWLEEYSTGFADQIAVNSQFTAKKFKSIFQDLSRRSLSVLYPSINCEAFDLHADPRSREVALGSALDLKRPFVVVSINRFEQKKRIDLAVRGVAYVAGKMARGLVARRPIVVYIAGGYDRRLRDNVATYEAVRSLAVDELRALVACPEHRYSEHVEVTAVPEEREEILCLRTCGTPKCVLPAVEIHLLRSISGARRGDLLRAASRGRGCLAYTPPDEHFGIVPLEAMYMRIPVVAQNSGGPCETVVTVGGEEEATGILCDNNPTAFGEAFLSLLTDPRRAFNMGEAGHTRVTNKFSLLKFGMHLERIIRSMGDQRVRK